MNLCPIFYEICFDQKYSPKSLRYLSQSLKKFNDFPYTAKEQVQYSAVLGAKLSIQGIQPKLSVKLDLKKETFEIAERKGTFIIKPPHHIYDEVPQNEDLTMRLAKMAGIEVPFHGMIYNVDGSLSYFIKRFDRARNQKIAVEDFSQLLGDTRDTKYDSTMEKVASVIEKHCTFPVAEKRKLFRLVIFNFLVGNEDMHLKNFSLIRRDNVELSPAYDLLNTTIIVKNCLEEIALPLRGKKNKLTRDDFFTYFGKERLKLSKPVLEEEFSHFKKLQDPWKAEIGISFLSEKMQKTYLMLLETRWERLNKE